MKITALIMVDLQNDFCLGGSLAVPEGDAVIAMANRLQPYFDVVVATKDWHPPNHMSFASNHPGYKVGEIIQLHGFNQILWPNHCVQGTNGSQFHPELNTVKIDQVFYKGVDASVDSYSAFYDNEHLRATGLEDYLKQKGVTDIYIMGLAMDYCVKYSCLDASRMDFNVYLIEDACRGVELKSGDVLTAIQEMEKVGVRRVDSKMIGSRHFREGGDLT